MKHSMYEKNEICKEYKAWIVRTVKHDYPEYDRKRLKELIEQIELSGYWETDINKLDWAYLHSNRE